MACLAAVSCIVATGLIALVKVESVLVTGPVLFAIGLSMFVGGLRGTDPYGWALGLSHCTLCVLLVMLVNVLHWSPSEAARPFLVIGIAYTVATMGATLAYLLRRPV
jgi:hypothetical protein